MADFVVEDRAWLHVVPRSLREVAVLAEPLTIAEKAFHEASRIQSRLPWKPSQPQALVLGAGAVGLLGAMKLIQEGYETYIYSLLPEPNPSAAIARRIGATYISSQEVPVTAMAAQIGPHRPGYEALGAAQLAFDVLKWLAPNGLFTLHRRAARGILRALRHLVVLSHLVLKNQAILGIVNSGRQAFADAIRDLGSFTHAGRGARILDHRAASYGTISRPGHGARGRDQERNRHEVSFAAPGAPSYCFSIGAVACS